MTRDVPTRFIRDRDHARRVDGWIKRNPDDPRVHDAMLEVQVFDWSDGRELSEHIRLEVAAAFWRGRKSDSGPVPLESGQPVPGCGCGDCTGISEDAEVRTRTSSRRRHASDLPPLPVEAARAVPILDVAARLGIQHRRGWALCFAHEDSDPSLHLNPKKNAAFCNVCGTSWDPIALVMELRGLPFADAVKELAA